MQKHSGGMHMDTKKVLIGMSGGVDSSVAAYLMQEAGYACVGGTMRLYPKPEGTADDVADAQKVAARMGIPHFVYDFQEEFARNVIEKFVRCYECGMTPNPCIDCNRHMKFDRFLTAALEQGCDYVASGHYARVRRDADTGRYLLCKAADEAKDQTYFLACLNQYQLSRVLFPLGDLTKAQVRQIAQKQGFVTAKKQDSQDICFVPDGDYAAFLQRYTGKHYPAGDFLDENGNVVGRHRGAVCYTLGQRKGLGVALGAPAYVCAKDMEKNTVTLGSDETLFSKGLRGNGWNWFPFPDLTEPMSVTAKIRHSRNEQPATVYPEENGFARVEFDVPQRAVTSGQAVVLYRGDIVIGGGTITEAIK